MVAGLKDEETVGQSKSVPDNGNGVIRVLMRRLGSTKTFGENMIFMLNRARKFWSSLLFGSIISCRTYNRRLLHEVTHSQDSLRTILE